MEVMPFSSFSVTKVPIFRSSALSPSLNYLPQDVCGQKFKLKSRKFSVCAAASGGDSVVTLLDYGAGNVRSVRNAIRYLGFDIKDVQCPEDILNANRLIFPGVGAFAAAMNVLNQKGMAEALCTYIQSDRPFLGICLGLQLLFESSEENGPVKGLGLVPGVVGRFDSSNGFRVPHIGWNALKIESNSGILDDIGGRHVYFVHSYRAMPSNDNKDWISSTCNYGDNFIASIRRGNVHAVQFHPEKSGVVGLSILRRFLQAKHYGVQRPIEREASKLAKRVIACLDVRANDRGDLVVTKGDQYDVREHTKQNEVRNLGKPVELAGQYYKDGADEVSFLNITGFRDFPLGDLPMLQVLRYTSENVFVPLTVGGGIRDFTDGNGRHYTSLEVASEYFRSGADKVSIGSDAVYAAEEYLRTGVKTGKSSLEQISRVYGNQAVVVSIDPRKVYVKNLDDIEFKAVRVKVPGPNGEEYAWYQCTVNGGREGRPIGAYELAKAVEELGAGEILLNCIDCDGQGKGFDIDLIKLISDAVSIPVIASSGAGAVEHFSEVFRETNASAALAAGIFHRKEVPIKSVKEHLLKEGVEVRM
ncbi:PREDICTED: imidazole glycerol phosphate synthase hisHF, chloroplastic [Nelumbo nucifera]|uniref:Imidazole glycerol phosphate synthase hisHF n=1 Tax=Nelumbo nucifera TaxID=4432 RepID=A0A1U8AAA3_NELNU|nr:PREDICTED: imidazole glycerol phosphate synthase hisHF, chloroplastic [Nelumbo nucifera]